MPVLSVTGPTPIIPGVTLAVSGSGWAPAIPVTITQDGTAVATVMPDASGTFTTSATAGAAGAHLFDAKQTTDQTAPVTVTPAPVAKADIIGVSVVASPAAPKVGDKVTFAITFMNDGGAAVPASAWLGVGLQVDGAQVTWAGSSGPLAAGASKTVNTSTGGGPWTASLGTHTVTAILDDQHNVAPTSAHFTIPLVVATTPTPPGPTPPPTTVPLALRPFPSGPWGTARGDGCVFDQRSVVPGGVNINTIWYGVTINGANYPSPVQQGLELATSNIQSDGITAYETNAWVTGGQHTVTDLRGTGVNIYVPNNAGLYLRATKMSLMAGVLRNWELQAADLGDVHAIKHPISLGISGLVLNKGYVWPAFATDNFAPSNTGFMPAGGFMAIPMSATMPAGLNNVAKAIWQALRDYGAYEVDATGGVNGPAPSLTIVEAEAAADAVVNKVRGAQIASVMAQLRWVTNATQAQVGGPGARLA